MTLTVCEILKFVKENDVKFIRLAFCDLLGTHKHITITAHELEKAFEKGISFDAYAIKGFSDITESDLLLVPDAATLSVLPWRPQQGRIIRFYCDIKNPDGSPFGRDCRTVLKESLKKAEEKGYICQLGAECEFYLFKTDENGKATSEPFDEAGYLDVQPLDKSENIRREICLSLEELGIRTGSAYHEQGPGQNKIDFKFSDALTCADNLITFKSTVKMIAARNGLFASFLPKPLKNKNGSGMHINLSLKKNGKNIYKNEQNEYTKEAESFLAGILEKTPEMTLFFNTLPNSYERFGQYEAPKYVSWAYGNRSQLVRIPRAVGEQVRMELRSPDCTMNPYLAFALILQAGILGIEQNLTLPDEMNADLYTSDNSITKQLKKLPESLSEAWNIASKSSFAEEVVTPKVFAKYMELKKEECDRYEKARNQYEDTIEVYFQTV